MPFEKGQSGNPSGRPKERVHLEDVSAEAKQYAELAIRTLVKICKSPKSTAASRVAAANAILDRAYGRPTQQLETTGEQTLTIIADKPMEYEDWLREYCGTSNPGGPDAEPVEAATRTPEGAH